MENRSKLILACMILVMLGVLGGTEMVAARSRGAALLSLCIRNHDRCYHSCYDFDAPLPPGPAEGYCWAQCDANHAACVDLAKGSPEAVLKTSALNRSYSLFALFRGAGEFKRNDKRPGFREGFATPPYGDLSLKP